MRTLMKTLVTSVILLFAALSAVADTYPSRPVTLIIPWAAGGGSDAMGRMVGALLERDLKQPVVVVNRAGGSGVVGHSAMATATPDGYTLGLATMEISVFKGMGLAELTPQSYSLIAKLAALDADVIVRADAPYANARALIDAVRKAPEGKFKAGGSGQGSAWHLALGGWLVAEGIKPAQVRYVPSAGASASLQELVAGGVDFCTCSATEARSLIDAGKVRQLAVMAPERSQLYPDVPTLQEATGVDWQMASWFAVVAPKGLAPEIAVQVTDNLKRIYERPEFQKFLKERGFRPAWETGAQFEQFASTSTQRLTTVIDALGLKK